MTKYSYLTITPKPAVAYWKLVHVDITHTQFELLADLMYCFGNRLNSALQSGGGQAAEEGLDQSTQP